MKIAIVCDPIDLDQKTWIPVYCEKIVRELMQDDSNEYVFFHMRDNPIFNGFENVVLQSWQTFWIANALRSFWKKFYLLPREFRRRNIEVVHELNVIGSHIFDPFRKYRSIVTVFDLTPILFRQHHWFLTVLAFNLFVKRSVGSADGVIAISQATKNDLIKIYGIDGKKIKVTLLWTDVLEREIDPSIEFDSPFVLSVGTLEPRKNLRNLIKAFVAMKERGDWIGVKLVLSWKKWWKTESLFDELALNKKFASDIVLTGFLSDSQLAYLYKTCQVFAYPSYYEWFWLPVLEAMSLGAPVITSNTSSIPEVAGNACLLVCPDDVQEISLALSEVLNNPDLRSDLIRRWIDRSKNFSWKKCAKETIWVYG